VSNGIRPGRIGWSEDREEMLVERPGRCGDEPARARQVRHDFQVRQAVVTPAVLRSEHFKEMIGNCLIPGFGEATRASRSRHYGVLSPVLMTVKRPAMTSSRLYPGG
jgi:hypothetical protein